MKAHERMFGGNFAEHSDLDPLVFEISMAHHAALQLREKWDGLHEKAVKKDHA